MLIMRITQTCDESDRDEWNKLLSSSLGIDIHPGRKQGFILAREALRECYRERGIDIPIAKLKFLNYSTLEQHAEDLISLSHHKNWGAALLVSRLSYRSGGIDIEDRSRRVLDQVLERISHPEDMPLEGIELWSVKEAIFKCLWNTGMFERPFEFASIVVRDKSWIHPDSGLSGSWSFFSHPTLVVCVALMPVSAS
jgi:hypothetical protein